MSSSTFSNKLEEESVSTLMKRFTESANSQKHPLVKTKMLDHHLKFVNDNKLQTAIEEDAKLTFPLTHSKVRAMATQFLAFKLDEKNGTASERALYKDMTLKQFFTRLLTKRPVCFYGTADVYQLPNGKDGVGGFEKIGTDKEEKPLVLKDFLSYDEMKFSALLGIGGPAHLIPRMKNQKVEEKAMFLALVGPRFEKPGVMEYQECVIDKDCTTANGYGKEADPNKPKTRWLRMWAKFYSLSSPHLYSYKEAQQESKQNKNIVPLDEKGERYFNIEAYKQRIKLTILAYLSYANQCGQEKNKKSYVRIPALGLGCWNIDSSSPFLANLMIEAYKEVLDTCDFPHISAIEFCRFDHVSSHKDLPDKSTYERDKNSIQVYYSPMGDFADKLPENHKNDLLVSAFAWDGNSRIGNEFYNKMFSASVDPMAACGSTILFTHCYSHNPDNITGDRLVHYDQRKAIFTKHSLTSVRNEHEEKEVKSSDAGSVADTGIFKPKSITSNKVVTLSIAPSKELVVQFATKEERNSALQLIGQHAIESKFVNKDDHQYKKNSRGLTPVIYMGEDNKLYFPTYQIPHGEEVGVDLASPAARTKLLKLLELNPDLECNNHLVGGGQSKTTYGQGLITAYTGTDKMTGKNQDSVIYFPKNHLIFSEGCHVEISAEKTAIHTPNFLFLN